MARKDWKQVLRNTAVRFFALALLFGVVLPLFIILIPAWGVLFTAGIVSGILSFVGGVAWLVFKRGAAKARGFIKVP